MNYPFQCHASRIRIHVPIFRVYLFVQGRRMRGFMVSEEPRTEILVACPGSASTSRFKNNHYTFAAGGTSK